MIKLIASDIDGTLIREGTSHMDPLLYDTIRELKQRGILFAASSGRQYHSMKEVFAPVFEDVVFIAENGSNIMQSGKNLFFAKIPEDLVRDVAYFIRSSETSHMTLSNPETLYLEEGDTEFYRWLRDGYRFHVSLVEDVLTKAGRTNKLALWNPDPVRTEQLALAAREQFGDRINAALAGNCWIDFMRGDVSKGSAVRFLQEKYGITKEETLAFGDSWNDIPMMEEAGRCFAVENAHPLVKEMATGVIGPCWDGSVIKKVREICLSGN